MFLDHEIAEVDDARREGDRWRANVVTVAACYRRQAAAKKKLRTFSREVRPEYDPCQGTSQALQMPMSCGRFSVSAFPKIHHPVAIPDRIG